MHQNLEKSIKDLPNEILLTIFSYLHTQDVKNSISNVCVRWSALARDKKLWKHLSYKTTSKSTRTFGPCSWFSTLGFLKNTSELQNVIISQGHSEEEVLELFQVLNDHCPNLRRIHFNLAVGFALNHLKKFERILQNVEEVKLPLRGTHGGILKTLARFKNLKRVGFVGADPEPVGFRFVLKECPGLRDVDVSEVDFSKQNFLSLCEAKNKITHLRMKVDKLDEECLKLVAMFPNLRDLMLTDGNTTPEKLFRIGMLKCLNTLHLQEDVFSPVLTATTLIDFFKNGDFQNLKELKLHKSRLNDEGAAEIRRNCPNMAYLEVMTYPRSLSSLTEKALLHFVHCKSLRHFEILFDNSQEADWTYRRKHFVRHDCEVDGVCPLGLEELLRSWDELQIPID